MNDFSKRESQRELYKAEKERHENKTGKACMTEIMKGSLARFFFLMKPITFFTHTRTYKDAGGIKKPSVFLL